MFFFFQVTTHSWNSYHIYSHCIFIAIKWNEKEKRSKNNNKISIQPSNKNTITFMGSDVWIIDTWKNNNHQLFGSISGQRRKNNNFEIHFHNHHIGENSSFVYWKNTPNKNKHFVTRVHPLRTSCGQRCNAKIENEPQRTTRRNQKNFQSPQRESITQTLYPLPCVLCTDVSMRLSFITNIHSTQMYYFSNEMKIRSSLELGPKKNVVFIY